MPPGGAPPHLRRHPRTDRPHLRNGPPGNAPPRPVDASILRRLPGPRLTSGRRALPCPRRGEGVPHGEGPRSPSGLGGSGLPSFRSTIPRPPCKGGARWNDRRRNDGNGGRNGVGMRLERTWNEGTPERTWNEGPRPSGRLDGEGRRGSTPGGSPGYLAAAFQLVKRAFHARR